MISRVYETSRLSIKQLYKDSTQLVLDFLEENRSDFEPWEPMKCNNFYTLSYQKASLSAEHYQAQEKKFLRYWVFLKGNPEVLIGTFCFQNFLKEPYQSCALGYKFDHRYRNQGYAYESVNKGIEILLENYPIHRIEAFIMPTNLPSIGLINKLNFTYEGVSHSLAKINGQWADHNRYSYINNKVSLNP